MLGKSQINEKNNGPGPSVDVALRILSLYLCMQVPISYLKVVKTLGSFVLWQRPLFLTIQRNGR